MSEMTPLPPPSAEVASALIEVESAGSVLGRTATGAGWIVGWRMLTRVLGLVNTLILTRLLAPADFGLVALGSSFAISLDALSTLGIEDALVREKSPDRSLYDTGFTLNLIRGGLTCVLLTTAALPLAAFFRESRLGNVLLALAFSTLLSGLTNIGTVEFRRTLSFDREFRLLVLPRLAGVLVTVVVGIVARNYWALIAGIMTGRILGVVFSYVMHPYRPRLTLRSWRRLAGFSGWTWALSIAALVRDRTDGFFIGWSLNASQVGIYSIGIEIADLPTTEVVGPLGRACFSAFATLRNSGEDSGQIYLRVIASVTLLTFPIAVGISLLADPLVRLAFGPKWIEAISVIQITALFCATTVFGQISYSLFSAHAMLRTIFGITVVAMALRVLLLVLLVPRLGILGGVFAAGIPMVCEYTTYQVVTFRRFGLHLNDLWRSIWRTMSASVAMAACLYELGFGWTSIPGSPAELAIEILESVILGAVVYIVTAAGLWLAQGRPAGGEADILTFSRQVLSRVSWPWKTVRRT